MHVVCMIHICVSFCQFIADSPDFNFFPVKPHTLKWWAVWSCKPDAQKVAYECSQYLLFRFDPPLFDELFTNANANALFTLMAHHHHYTLYSDCRCANVACAYYYWLFWAFQLYFWMGYLVCKSKLCNFVQICNKHIHTQVRIYRPLYRTQPSNQHSSQSWFRQSETNKTANKTMFANKRIANTPLV